MALQRIPDIGQDPRESFPARPNIAQDPLLSPQPQTQLQNFGRSVEPGGTFQMNPETGYSVPQWSPERLPDVPALTPPQQARQDAIAARMAGGEVVGTNASPLIQQQQLQSIQGREGSVPQSTPEELATVKALGGGPEAERMVREARQQQTIKDSGAIAASKKIVESLREQGVSDDAIKAAVDGSATNSDQFRALNRLNRKEGAKRARGANEKRISDKLTAKERRNEDGTAKNDAAVAVDFDDFFSDFGDDPLSDKSNYDFMTKSQQREYNRYRSKAAQGNASDSDTRRIAKFQKDIGKKRAREFETKQAKEAKRVLDAKEKATADELTAKITKAKTAATSAAEKRFYETRERKLKVLELQLKNAKSAKQKTKIREQMAPITEEVVVGFQGKAPQPATEQESGRQPVTEKEREDALDWLEKNPDSPLAPKIRTRIGV